jgi:uncharacterized protein YndB with AHSA1/START domain
MTKPDFVYVSYIATTPHKVWQALTDPELMRQYWGDPAAGCSRMNISDWKVGSRWEHQQSYRNWMSPVRAAFGRVGGP